MQKHKIDGALNQNTNSNHNFKTNQIRTKKNKIRRRAKLTHLSLGGEDMQRWEEKKGTHLTHLRERERERERELLECFGVDEVLEKKRKKKSEETKGQKRKEKRKRSEDRAPTEEGKK